MFGAELPNPIRIPLDILDDDKGDRDLTRLYHGRDLLPASSRSSRQSMTVPITKGPPEDFETRCVACLNGHAGTRTTGQANSDFQTVRRMTTTV